MWTRCREWASPLQQRGTILIDYPITLLGPQEGSLKDPIASGKAVTTNERPGAKCHSTRRRGEGSSSGSISHSVQEDPLRVRESSHSFSSDGSALGSSFSRKRGSGSGGSEIGGLAFPRYDERFDSDPPASTTGRNYLTYHLLLFPSICPETRTFFL